MKMTPWTRSGCSAARTSVRWAPSESVTTNAFSVWVASSTASASAANSDSSYASLVCGRSDFPFPRGSKATTR